MSIGKEGLARLQLSLLAEPGDPRLVRLLDDSSAEELVAALTGGRRLDVPPNWTARAHSLVDQAVVVLERAASHGLRWISVADKSWPLSVGDLDHVEPINGATGAPLGLWIRGPADLAELCTNAVAIVGARDATTYGCDVASDLASDLADNGVTVVSGAAFGIDVCAHRGAIAMGKQTIAVLAGGADVHYPRAHTSLLERIAADSLVVSEQLPGQAPIKSRFLSRNRLIAAMTSGTVVVEAARRSGSLNTLNWADQLGRVTMGVPGPVTSNASVGVHQALRSGKAIVVTNGAEVLEAVGVLGFIDATPDRAPESAYDRLPGLARRILDALPWGVVRSAAEIGAELGVSMGNVDDQLIGLERVRLVNRETCGWSLQRRADLLR